MENIKMEFRHPKYYKELRKRNKSDQVISWKQRDGVSCACTWSGPHEVASNKQVTSSKRQAFEPTCSTNKRQASQP